MGTAAKSTPVSHSIEEFLAYDSRGHIVVLRRNVEHPGDPVDATEARSRPGFSLKTKPGHESQSVGGGFGFFSGFHEVRERLRQKGFLAK